MSRVIIIGASGFLGSHLLELLLKENYEVLAVKHHSEIAPRKGLEFMEGGISALHTKTINDFRPDVVFHCARPTIPHFKRSGRIMASKLAAYYNSRLIARLKQSDHQPLLVFASGSLMYGSQAAAHTERSELNPVSFARQYYRGEQPILKALKSGEYPVQHLRFPWLLGHGSWFLWFYLNKIKEYRLIPQFGDALNMMQLLDVRDAAQLMFKYAIETGSVGIFNMASPNILSQSEFITEVSGQFGVETKNYTELFDGKLEKEALEAYTSNIILETQYRQILGDYLFISVNQSLEYIRKMLAFENAK